MNRGLRDSTDKPKESGAGVCGIFVASISFVYTNESCWGSPKPLCAGKETQVRRRNKQINLRLSADEYDRLKKDVMKSGLTVQTYLRLLIRQIQPKEMPSADLINVLKSLQRIGNNMNQIAIVANSKGFVDTEAYWENVERLQREVSSLLEVMY